MLKSNSLVAYLRRQFHSKLARSATWMLQGQGLQLAAQFGYFVVVAHLLGPSGYGTFVACTALVLTLAPFSPWGAGQVMVKYAARDRELLPVYFGNAILVTVVSGLLLTIVLSAIRPILLPRSVTEPMLIMVAVADLICTQLTAVCGLAFMAVDDARKSAGAAVMAAVFRLVAACLLLTSAASPARWAEFYVTAAAAAALYQVFAVSRYTSIPRIQLRLIYPSLREGFHFATSEAARTIYDNIDKTMLARLSTVESAAIYAVAYRFVDASMLPIRALAAATYPEFFRQGVHGITGTFRLARRILKRSVLYGLGVTVVLFVAAGVIPRVMGAAYAESSDALRWLCVLPLIKSVHAFLTDTLTGADYQWQRSSVQIGVAVFNVVINLWLISAYAWRGASWSSIASDFALMAFLYVVIRWHLRREKSALPQEALAA